jgi:NADH-quinone oxidoreductase subunit J
MFIFIIFFFLYLALTLTTHIYFVFWLILFTNIIVSCAMTILAVNPINSIFFLIALFLNVSIALFSLNLIYLALILIIVYVGALAIFFLFTVMLLNVNLLFTFRIRSKLISFFDFFILLLLFIYIVKFLLEIFPVAIFLNNEIIYNGMLFDFNSLFLTLLDLYAMILYTVYGSIFVLLGVFLFIIMIGVILLIQQNNFLLKLSTDKPIFRNFKTTIFHASGSESVSNSI